MSELKAFDIVVAEEGYCEGIVKYRRAVYDKSEVDKAIANRDYEIDKLKESISNLLKMNTEQVMVEVMKKALIYGEGFVSVEHAMKLVAELRHQKYKRCLAMAMWCKSNSEIYNEFAADASEYMPSYEARFRRRAVLYQKWAMRWLELAEKFKGSTNET